MHIAKNVLLLLALTAGLVGIARGQQPLDDFSNDGLIKAKLRANELVKTIQPSGDTFVLPADYFLKRFTKEYEFPTVNPLTGAPVPGAPVSRLGLANTDKKVLICTIVAEGMLEVAALERAAPADYVSAWMAKQRAILDFQNKDKIPLMDRAQKTVWELFFKEWIDDVINVDPARFRDALRQAAYSILRVGLDKEQEQIDKVLKGGATPSGTPSAAAATSLIAGGYVGSYHHSTVVHERLMNGIYRRHDRRMYKIERIQARR